ncbi:MAG: tetratricopeptide repeat protein [Labilithrix sp.]|nr:tetratricopeptide repeat protein [Labilithrix sp.]
MKLRFGVVVIALLLAHGGSAAAADDLSRARALFDEAGELERQGRWDAAQDRLRAAIRIRETPHLRYALGWALENDEKLLEARTEYELALRLARRGSVEEVTRLATARIAEVDRKTPLVQIRVRGRLLPTTRISVEGRPVAVRDDAGTVSVDPGSRVVRVERRSKGISDRTITVRPGVLRVVEVEGDEMPPPSVARSAALAKGVAPDRAQPAALPWVLVAGGGALTLGATGLLVSSPSGAWTQDAAAAAMGTAGLVSLGVGTLMLLSSARDEPRRARVDVTPTIGGARATIAF